MNMLKWISAGCVGGLIGAAIWALISYATNYEIGWIAWAIGGLVGVCVRFAAGEDNEGVLPGVGAATIAIGSVLLGKFLAIHFLVSSLVSSNAMPPIAPNDMIVKLADEIVRAREAKGQKVVFPKGMHVDLAESEADYPRDIWQQAAKKWAAMPPPEQQATMKAEEAHRAEFLAVMQSKVRQDGFMASFGVFDLLWFFLAAATAFRLGSGAVSEGD